MSSAGASQKAHIPVRIIGDGALVWSMSPVERLRRMFARIGVEDVAAWDGTVPTSDTCIVISGEHVFSQVLLADLSRQPGTVLTEQGRPVAAHCSAGQVAQVADDIATGVLSDPDALNVVEPHELSSAYDVALRKNEIPYVMQVSPETIGAIEKRTFAGSYKGVTDFVTRHVWPVPAIAVTRWCAKSAISPNTVTTVSLVLVLVAMLLFWNGFFAVGLVAAWLMTFLDTVDGKLARVTVTSTKWGNVYDHGIDLIHPPFWYWAWFVGVTAAAPSTAGLEIALWVTIIGYVLQRVQEGIFIARFKLEMHVWRRFDSLYRLVVARRNPNLVLLTVFTLMGQPAGGLIAVGVWTFVSLVVHSIQIFQALRAEQPIKSWLDH